MVFPEAAAKEVEAEVDELEALSTVQLREKKVQRAKCSTGVGDKHRSEVLRHGLRAARGAVQQAAAAAAAAVAAAAHALAAGALLPLQLRRQRSFASEGVPGSSLQATAGRRHTNGSGATGGGGRAGGRGRRRSSCVGGGPQ
jgi:hypothetical protein